MKQLRIFVKPLVAKFAEVERKRAESTRFDSVRSLWPSMEQFILSQVQIGKVENKYDGKQLKYTEMIYIDVTDEFYLKHKDVSSFTLTRISNFIENLFYQSFFFYIHGYIDYYIVFKNLPNHVKKNHGISKRLKAVNMIKDFRKFYGLQEDDIRLDTLYRKYKRHLKQFEKKQMKKVSI